jgi:hypothetical protein
MKRNWDDIKWIFDMDGGIRDIYVQEVSISDWEKLIDLLNEKYSVKSVITGEERNQNQIDKEHVIKFLTDETGEMDSPFVSIDIGEIQINCHFFLTDQIEFDLNPEQINSIEDFEKVKKFMETVSQDLSNQVTLTGENSPEFPFVKIDKSNRISKVLTEAEVKTIYENSKTFKAKMTTLKTTFQMKFFPKKFKELVMKNANDPYKSTKKNRNVW